MSGYVNIHGEALALSARDSVIALKPRAYSRPSEQRVNTDEPMVPVWLIRAAGPEFAPDQFDRVLGSGVNEEAAWRSALSGPREEDL